MTVLNAHTRGNRRFPFFPSAWAFSHGLFPLAQASERYASGRIYAQIVITFLMMTHHQHLVTLFKVARDSIVHKHFRISTALCQGWQSGSSIRNSDLYAVNFLVAIANYVPYPANESNTRLLFPPSVPPFASSLVFARAFLPEKTTKCLPRLNIVWTETQRVPECLHAGAERACIKSSFPDACDIPYSVQQAQ